MAASSHPHLSLPTLHTSLSAPFRRILPQSYHLCLRHHSPGKTYASASRPLRAVVIGGGPAGSSAAEALAAGGAETFMIERSPSGSKPCGGAIPLCMLDEFSIPADLIDRRVTQMRIVSPSNLHADFGSALRSGEHIPMLRREVLDAFLRRRAESRGVKIISGLFTDLQIPADPAEPYLIRYVRDGSAAVISADVVVGADGANSRVAKAIDAGPYLQAIAFQERIRLPAAKMERYADLAEMYVGEDVSPDFYGWVFPKCDHVAVGTGTTVSRAEIKRLQAGMRARAGGKIAGGEVIKVEAHPIPEHPRARRVRGRVALVGDAAGYVTKCSGEGIYFAAKSGRMCGEAMIGVWKRRGVTPTEEELKREYLGRWDGEYGLTFRFLDLLQRVFYGSNAGREALVEMCKDEYVQRMTFESYFYKRLVRGDPWRDAGLLFKTIGSLARTSIVGREMSTMMKIMAEVQPPPPPPPPPIFG